MLVSILPARAASVLEAPAVVYITSGAPLPPLPPPPRVKPASPSISGRTDLPMEIAPGFIRARVRPGLDINALLRKYNIGPASYWNTPPFDESDVRAGLDRSLKIAVPIGAERNWTLSLVGKTAEFEYVQPVWKEKAELAFAPNDPRFPTNQAGYLNAINIQTAWNRTVSYTGVIVAIIDGGVRANHEDAGLWKEFTGYDAFTKSVVGSGYMTDSNCAGGHGSHVTSIAVGDTNNGKGIAGVGFNSAYRPIKFIAGDCVTVPQSRADAIRWAKNNFSNVINMSYTLPTYDVDEQNALSEAWAAGVTNVVAAGNLNTTPAWPCRDLYVICVGGTDNFGNKWSSSNFGSAYVDVAAPAINIYGMGNASDTNYIVGSGTSYAAPQVAGIAALLLSIGKNNNQQWTAICNTSRPTSPTGFTACGWVDAGAALYYP